MKRSRKNRRRVPFWRRRRNRIAFHVTLVNLFVVGGFALPDYIRIWLLCAIPVVLLSSIKLWVLYETRRLTVAEVQAKLVREAERRKAELACDAEQRQAYRNSGNSTAMSAGGWSHGFFS